MELQLGVEIRADRSYKAPTWKRKGEKGSGMFRGGEIIREARLRAGLSQQELADRLGTSQSVITRWESGHRSPTVQAMIRAVRACGLDVGVSLATYDREHELLIEQNLALSPEGRLDKMVQDRRGLQDLVGLSKS
jgi:transcriptional regulator with XRE-family HTH domain